MRKSIIFVHLVKCPSLGKRNTGLYAMQQRVNQYPPHKLINSIHITPHCLQCYSTWLKNMYSHNSCRQWTRARAVPIYTKRTSHNYPYLMFYLDRTNQNSGQLLGFETAAHIIQDCPECFRMSGHSTRWQNNLDQTCTYKS